MLSSVSDAAFNNRRQGHDTLGKSYTERASKGLSFRVFKGPSLSTYQPVATAKFDFGYHSIPANDPRQNQNWYMPRTHDMTTASALRDTSKASRNRGGDTSNRNRVHDVNLRNLPSSYSIYQSASKNTYIYERSLSSKSDIYSDYDDSASTTTVSPAMSTDSLTTLKSPATSRPTTPNPANSYYAPHASMSGKPQSMTRENSFNHDPSHVSMPNPGEAMQPRERNVSSTGRPTTPASLSFNSTARSSTPSSSISRSVPRPIPGRIPSVISEEDELERIAKINAAYNARTSSFFPSSLSRSPESANLPNAHPYSAASAPPQSSSANIYSSVPKSSVIDGSSRHGRSASSAGVEHAYPLYQPTVELPVENSRNDTVPAQVYAHRKDHRDSGQCDDFIPSLGSRYEEPGLAEAHPLHRPQSPGYSGIPRILNEGHPEKVTLESRARSPLYDDERPTRQMPSPEKVMATEHKQDRPLPTPPPVARQTSYHRERKASFSQYLNPHVQDFVASENMSTSAFIPGIAKADSIKPTSGNVSRSPVGQRPMPPSNYSSRQADAQRGIAENISTPFVANTVDGDAASTTRAHRLPSAKAQNNMAPIYEARNPHELELPSSKPSRSPVESYYTPSNVPFPSISPTEGKSLPEPELFVSGQHVDSTPRTSTSDRVTEPKVALNVPHFIEMEPLPRSGATGTSRPKIYAQDHGKGQPEPASRSSRRATSGYATDTEGQSLRQKGSLLQPQVTYTSSTHSGILLNPNAQKSSERSAFSVPIAEKPQVVTTQRSPTESRSRTSSSSSRRPAHEPYRRRSDGDQPLDGAPISLQTALPTHALPTVPHSVASTHRMTTHPSASNSEPQRRYSDGDRVAPPPEVPSGRNSAPLSRSVRWNENLVCPSPSFPNQRRKGWFNRRGDQLWTNDGAYKPAPATQEYPPDLDGYPEYGQGWMNEDGIRIDMGHHRIPKAPLRSALKQSRA